MNKNIEHQSPQQHSVTINETTSRTNGAAQPYTDEEFVTDYADFNKILPVQLEWRDITFKVRVRAGILRKRTKTILHPMSGFAAPGDFLAIMGPSGSGKTSLLNILVNRVKQTSGDLIVNGEKMSKKFRAISAFVQQDDVLMGNLSVWESLRFAALLRLPKSLSYKKKMEVCEAVILELGLGKCKHTKIGIPGIRKGISGGERKRLCIAMEMITHPSVLFLDEPTTGLDAKTALNIMETLLRLTQKGITVICTIHQPRSNIFKLFDNLLLLANGRIAYFGKATDATEYFKGIGLECPKEYNPADFFIDLVTPTTGDTEHGLSIKEKDEERIACILQKWETFPKKQIEGPTVSPQLSLKKQKIPKYASSWVNQCLVVFWRSSINILRDRWLTAARLCQTVVLALLVGLLYLNIGNDQESIQNRSGALFFVVVNQSVNALFTAINVFPADKAVFLRERGSKAYRVSSYFTGKSMAEIPTQIIMPLIFSIITYFMVGFQLNASKFGIYLFTLIVTSLTGQAWGLTISAFCSSRDVALTIAPVISVLLMLFGGFYINIKDIPIYFIWVYYISFYRYAFEALVINEFSGLVFTCRPEQQFRGNCRIRYGEEVIEQYGMGHMNLWGQIGILIGMIAVLRIAGYLALRFVQKPKI